MTAQASLIANPASDRQDDEGVARASSEKKPSPSARAALPVRRSIFWPFSWNGQVRRSGGTFSTIILRPEDIVANAPSTKYAQKLFGELSAIKDDRYIYFDDLRRKSSAWVNGSRRLLAVLGSVAFLLTASAAGLNFIPANDAARFTDLERWTFLAALLTYALMGAFAFYDRTTDATSAYFRHVTILLSIRDLWSTFEFSIAKCLTNVAPDDSATTTKQQLLEVAQAFSKELDAVTAQEMTDWKTEFTAALSQLQQAADKGGSDLNDRLEALEKATKATADEAIAAAKPGLLNITISDDFDGQAVIFVDEKEAVRTSGKHTAIANLATGPRTIRIGAKKGDREMQTAVAIEIKPGINDRSFDLS
ncbi:hypothetical protein [Rhizobium mayense]|uniref:SMODS and SLOG-associating 2TM effector domain-containing protein n=1 Tax=Rhizobium mayense TaxID=1312184 RepID=A0ABT7K6T0_9HYPH|nr:hypothetical protein [Rhizobium mayense]MDL2403103.1 hypothetical protein [Rhizobium mayense]